MELNLEALRDALLGRHTVSELCVAAATLGLSVAEQTAYVARSYQYAMLTFPGLIPASALCEAMGWTRPYALSGDVDQRRWHVQLWAGDLADPRMQRIATRRPEVGPWAVTTWLAGRPGGRCLELSPAPRPPMIWRRTWCRLSHWRCASLIALRSAGRCSAPPTTMTRGSPPCWSASSGAGGGPLLDTG